MRPSLLSAVALTIVALYAMPAAAQVFDDTASVEFEDQTIEGSAVTVASVTLPEGGFVTIHDDTLNDGDAVGSVVGTSEYLENGTHENVRVNINATGSGNITLIAMPHQDTNNNQQYDFVTSQGQEDGAYTETIGGGAVTDEAQVDMSGQQDGLDQPDDDGLGDGQDDDVVDGEEDTPGFGAVALLAVVGAVAALRRR